MKKYQAGGTTTASMLGESSSLSPWAGPYVTGMLGKGAALSELPYQAYMGPLTAGESDLQQQAFQGLANLAMPTSSQMSYTPMSFTGSSFTQPMAQQPMAQQALGGFRLPTATEQAEIDQRRAQRPAPLTRDEMAKRMAMDIPSFEELTQAQPQAQPQAQTQISATSPVSMAVSDFINNQSGMGFPAFQQAQPQAQPQAQIQAPAMPQAQPQAQPSATSVLEQYMSPFLQGALDPQYAAAQRQAEIAAQQLQSQFGKAGAYGGSRQGVAEAELQRGLLDRMAGITGQGYQQAFEQAQQQFNTEQQRQMAATGQAQQYGLQALGAQRLGGAEQRAIEGQGIAADIAQFKEERDYPYKQVQYQQSLLQGLPISTQSYQYAEPSTLSNVMSGAGGILGLLETMGLFGKKE